MFFRAISLPAISAPAVSKVCDNGIMSNLFGRAPAQDDSRSVPVGDAVGRYTSYLDAQKAVDYLADQQFAVENVSIIGNDLKTVERVTGRLSYPRVALASAATGAWFGFFVGLILMLFGGQTSYASVISSMALGAVFWLLFGVIAYAFQRGKRDFTSTSQVVATSYDVIVAPAVSAEARQLLARLPMNGRPADSFAPPYHAPQRAPHSAPRDERDAPRHAAQDAPERPTAWGDPYAGTRPDSGQPEGGRPAAEPSADVPPAAAPTPSRYPDLPDGRPQYGVRLPEHKDAGNPDRPGAEQN